jgi:hypothetical protein
MAAQRRTAPHSERRARLHASDTASVVHAEGRGHVRGLSDPGAALRRKQAVVELPEPAPSCAVPVFHVLGCSRVLAQQREPSLARRVYSLPSSTSSPGLYCVSTGRGMLTHWTSPRPPILGCVEHVQSCLFS